LMNRRNLSLIPTLFINIWLDRVPHTIDLLEEIFVFFREYRVEQGIYLPYTGIKLLYLVRELFDSASSEDKDLIVSLCREYLPEVDRSNLGDLARSKLLLKDILDLIEQEKPDSVEKELDKLSPFYELSFNFKENLYQLIVSFDRNLQKPQVDYNLSFFRLSLRLPYFLSNEDFDKLIKEIEEEVLKDFSKKLVYFEQSGGELPSNFMPDNLRQLRPLELTDDKIKAFIDKMPRNFRTKKIRKFYVDSFYYSDDYDRAREVDPEVASAIMDKDEFDEFYFGQGRKKYIKTSYLSIDSNIQTYVQFHNLWLSCSYALEFDALPKGTEKCEFLVKTYPCCNALRDQLIVKSINWSELNFNEDVLKVQEYISSCADIGLLSLLCESFSDNLLKISCSKRLHDLSKNVDHDDFIDALDEKKVEETYKIAQQLYDGDSFDPDFLILLLSFPERSFVRDELLREFIDSAKSEKITINISSLLSDPPPSTVQHRDEGTVAINETLVDFFQRMSVLDKEEVMLYLLGHRRFYSALAFDPGKLDEERNLMLYTDSFATFYNEYHFKHMEADGAYFYYTDVNCEDADFLQDLKSTSEYFVSEPDSLIMLSKYAGIPLELIFQHQKSSLPRREQRDLLEYILLGDNGILTGPNADKFLRKVANLLANDDNFSANLDGNARKAVEELLATAFLNCPQSKLPDLFLDCWSIQFEEGLTLPDIVASLIQKVGSVFIKAGQYLATQTATLPPEWIRAFRSLCDRNSEADKTILYEYEYHTYKGNSPFSYLGEKLGEGSMAAVYKGQLKETDDMVAVKVVHPWIEKEINEDIGLLKVLVDFINSNPDLYGIRLPDNLPEVIKTQMYSEVDLAKEAQNSDLLEACLSESICGVSFALPKYKSNVSKGNFLVMDFGGGVVLDDEKALKEKGLDGQKLRNVCGLEILRQVMEHGIYQADPNLGNFSVSLNENDEAVVNWLDTGHVAQLSKSERTYLKDFVKSMFVGPDKDLISNFLFELLQSDGLDKEYTVTEISKWAESNLSLEGISLDNLESILKSFLDFAAENKFLLKNSWLQLIKTLGLLKPLLHDCSSEMFMEVLLPVLMK
ncbi:hypothetical protein GF354_06130, partial [Candidatus Peregrinibacteria bacterium]|nr:hypothetical protein [Candidatus Peregrinibacteria bacterium]